MLVAKTVASRDLAEKEGNTGINTSSIFLLSSNYTENNLTKHYISKYALSYINLAVNYCKSFFGDY
jgi:hypothetical protein